MLIANSSMVCSLCCPVVLLLDANSFSFVHKFVACLHQFNWDVNCAVKNSTKDFWFFQTFFMWLLSLAFKHFESLWSWINRKISFHFAYIFIVLISLSSVLCQPKNNCHQINLRPKNFVKPNLYGWTTFLKYFIILFC